MSDNKMKLEKPVFNLLYINDGNSRLTNFRGDVVFKNFITFYERLAHINLITASSKFLHSLKAEDFKNYNILWLDNVTDPVALQKINDHQITLMSEVSPAWREELTTLQKESEESAVAYLKDLKQKRSDILRVVYGLDEFIWEAPVGRVQTVQTTHLVESYLNIADTVVVPTPELKDAVYQFGFCNPGTEVVYIPTSVGTDFFPLFSKFSREPRLFGNDAPKPKILIKGISIPTNVQEMIQKSYKEFDIVISSVGELNDFVANLLTKEKISHIHHWANPGSNKRNIAITYAIERDRKFDFIVYCLPETSVIDNKYYEITMGDEDVLFAVASGAVPICGVEGIGYDEKHLYNSSELIFGENTSADDLKKMISSTYTDSKKFNIALSKCRSHFENRSITSPMLMGSYYRVLKGSHNIETKEAQPTVDSSDKVETKEDNVENKD